MGIITETRALFVGLAEVMYSDSTEVVFFFHMRSFYCALLY